MHLYLYSIDVNLSFSAESHALYYIIFKIFVITNISIDFLISPSLLWYHAILSLSLFSLFSFFCGATLYHYHSLIRFHLIRCLNFWKRRRRKTNINHIKQISSRTTRKRKLTVVGILEKKKRTREFFNFSNFLLTKKRCSFIWLSSGFNIVEKSISTSAL